MFQDQMLANRTIVILVTEDWYFWSHRLPIARAALDRGARVVVAARFGTLKESVEAEGFIAAPIPFRRAGLNPAQDARVVASILQIYRQFQPDLVHHVAAKPILLGSLAARFAGVPATINALTGLGYMFTQHTWRSHFAKSVFTTGLKFVPRRERSRFLVQNHDDRDTLVGHGLPLDRIEIIRGSGVNLAQYRPTQRRRNARPICLFVGRMLRDKGTLDLANAARILKARGTNVVIRLVGDIDDNPASLSREEIDAWVQEGIVEYGGRTDDVAGELTRADMLVLPSYREGLPKALLEGAACGLPLIATDVPGCREICIDGLSGVLVPPRNPQNLAEVIGKLASDPVIRQYYGRNGRDLVERHFSDEIVVQKTMNLYDCLISAR